MERSQLPPPKKNYVSIEMSQKAITPNRLHEVQSDAIPILDSLANNKWKRDEISHAFAPHAAKTYPTMHVNSCKLSTQILF